MLGVGLGMGYVRVLCGSYEEISIGICVVGKYNQAT